MYEKDKLLIEAVKDIDLTPTMERNAREKYGAISSYLNDHGLRSDFYPQGSFLLGTVIRPYRDGENKNYDLDILAKLTIEKHNTSPSLVKNDVGDIIKGSELYRSKLKKEDRNCWTLEYAEISDGIGFNLDIVSCVGEVDEVKADIIYSGVDPKYVLDTVSITDKRDEIYSWLTSNPLGFGAWFKDISDRFINYEMKVEQFNRMPLDIKNYYNTVEEIPQYFYKSKLQRAVQVIKRHRDVYYDRMKRPYSKPSSILITALVADAVNDEINLSIVDIIQTFIDKYNSGNISIMVDGKILNPVDKREDLFERYTESKKTDFKSWIDNLKDFIYTDSEIDFKKSIHVNINKNLFSELFDNYSMVKPTKPWMKK